MDRIAVVSADVETSLKEIKTILDSEEEQQKEYEIIVGTRPASGLSAELTHEYTKNHKAHSMASDSNATLHRAMKLHIDNLKLLSLPLPVLQSMVASMVDIDEDSEATITEMQTMIQKVEEMRMQRAMLCESLREDILSDDITKKLVQYKDENMSQIFAEELKKHDAKKRLIEQNICAQANILSALTEAKKCIFGHSLSASWWAEGGFYSTQNFGLQLTLFQPGWANNAHHITACPFSGFGNLTTTLLYY